MLYYFYPDVTLALYEFCSSKKDEDRELAAERFNAALSDSFETCDRETMRAWSGGTNAWDANVLHSCLDQSYEEYHTLERHVGDVTGGNAAEIQQLRAIARQYCTRSRQSDNRNRVLIDIPELLRATRAIRAGDTDALRTLVIQNPSLDCGNGRTLLHIAVKLWNIHDKSSDILSVLHTTLDIRKKTTSNETALEQFLGDIYRCYNGTRRTIDDTYLAALSELLSFCPIETEDYDIADMLCWILSRVVARETKDTTNFIGALITWMNTWISKISDPCHHTIDTIAECFWRLFRKPKIPQSNKDILTQKSFTVNTTTGHGFCFGPSQSDPKPESMRRYRPY